MPKEYPLDKLVEFAENPEPRCPCVLLLDTSGSMEGEPIESLNVGLLDFKEHLARDPLASRRVEVAVVTFDSAVTVVQDFVTADLFEPPVLGVRGMTRMGAAIHAALDMVYNRKMLYRSSGIAYYRPWVFMITDGEPEGEPAGIVETAVQRIRDDENNKHIAFFAVGVASANMAALQKISVRPPMMLQGLNFRGMFVWLSASMKMISQSKVGDQVALPPADWGHV